jgi:hypothetical protein
MSEAIERFKQRRKVLHAATRSPRLVLLPSVAASAQLASEPLDVTFVDGPVAVERFNWPQDVCNAEANAQVILAELSAVYDQDRFNSMMRDLLANIVQSIATPFGVGKFVSAFDKEGGNVDTIHNARQGIYASQDEQRRYQERGPYDKHAVKRAKAYKAAHRKMSESLDAGTLIDTYTDAPIRQADKNNEQLRPNLDHAIAAKRVHDDAGRVLAGLGTPELANVDANLIPTTQTINAKKNEHSAARLAQKLAQEAPARKARLNALEGRKANWTDKERKEYDKLKAQDSIDLKRVKEKEDKAQAEIDAKVNRTYYSGGKFAQAAVRASATEGAKMGVQQALGVILVEFMSAAISEVKDLYHQGRSEDSFVTEIRVRLRRVTTRVTGKWKTALVGLRDGFLAGLLSSLATTLINAFVTTGRRLVRMIREGFLSLVRAIKLLLLRPDGMSKHEVLHEASKIVVGAGILVGGIALEEVISKQLALVPGIGLIANAATAAIVGSVTAIATTFAVYLVDKVDLFKVNVDSRAEAVGNALDQRLADSIRSIEVVHTEVAAIAG